MSAREFVESNLHDPTKRVVVFSKTYCPYCQKAKQTLQGILGTNGVHVIELDALPPGGAPSAEAIQQVLGDMTGKSSVPRVFIDGEFIGGGDDVVAKAQSQELQMTLQQKGILPAEQVGRV